MSAIRISESFIKGLKLKRLDKPATSSRTNRNVHSNQDTEDRPLTREERQQKAVLDAAKRRQREWEQYLFSRLKRIERIRKESPGASRFLNTIAKIGPSIEYVPYADCDVDLAGLARKCGLSADTLGPYERYTLFEECRLYVEAACKRVKGEWDGGNWFELDETPTALDELKTQLGLH